MTTYYLFGTTLMTAPGFVSRGATVSPAIPDGWVISHSPVRDVYYQNPGCSGQLYVLEPEGGYTYANQLFWTSGSPKLYRHTGVAPTGTYRSVRLQNGNCIAEQASLTDKNFAEIADSLLTLNVVNTLPWSLDAQ